MNTQKLAEYIDSLEAADIRACECIIYKDHEKVFQKLYGHCDAEKKVPLSEDNLYWFFSATKVITCLAAVKLLDEGKISLEDPVSKYIPEYKDLMVFKDGSVRKAEKVMKIIHLFTMTGGLSYDFNTENLIRFRADHPHASTLDIVKAFVKDPLQFEPGEHYGYSLCHDVLAAVVEIASGMKFSQYLKHTFFEPLGIQELGFFPTDEQKRRFVTMMDYKDPLNVSFVREDQENRFVFSSQYESGGAGLFGEPREYVKILDMVACGGITKDGVRILSDNAIKMMGLNRLDEQCRSDFVSTPRNYGYGWGLCGRVHMNPAISLGKSPKGEFGWDGAAAAYALIDPINKISVFVSMHTRECLYAYEKIHLRIRDLVYED